MSKQIAVVTLVLTIAAVALAYDFDDPVFNQFLAEDLEHLESIPDGPRHPRNRRDEDAAAASSDRCKPPRRRKLCCAEASFEAMNEKDRDVKKQCFREVRGGDKEPRGGDFDPFRCDKVEKHRREVTCIVQCVGQKKDILDKDGNPKEAEFSKFVDETMAKESWFPSIRDKVTSACLAESRNATSNRDTTDSESCNPAGVKLAHCLFREIQLGCPAEQIKDQKACARARDKIKRHNDFFPPTQSFHSAD